MWGETVKFDSCSEPRSSEFQELRIVKLLPKSLKGLQWIWAINPKPMNGCNSHTAACDRTVSKVTPESIKRALNGMGAAPPLSH